MSSTSLMHLFTLCAGRVVLNTITVLGKCNLPCDFLFRNFANLNNGVLMLLTTGKWKKQACNACQKHIQLRVKDEKYYYKCNQYFCIKLHQVIKISDLILCFPNMEVLNLYEEVISRLRTIYTSYSPEIRVNYIFIINI